MGMDGREPRRAEMYAKMPDFARVMEARRTGADGKE